MHLLHVHASCATGGTASFTQKKERARVAVNRWSIHLVCVRACVRAWRPLMEQRVIILAKSRTGMKATRARVSETPQLMRFAVRHTYIYEHTDVRTYTNTDAHLFNLFNFAPFIVYILSSVDFNLLSPVQNEV